MESRLAEKLKQAGGVVKRLHGIIEGRADAIIEREAHVEEMIAKAFIPHEDMLNDTERGLEQLEKELATLSNDPLQNGEQADLAQDRQGRAIINKL